MTDAQRCPDVVRIDTESTVSAFTGEPSVRVILTFADGTEKTVAQQTPDQTRVMALHWLQIAEAAVHDAAVAKWLETEMGLDKQTAAAAIAGIRKHRADQR